MASPTTSWMPHTDADRHAVEEQLERVLAHHTFRSSKRCAALLRHVVQSTLHGHGALLKERTLGVEVFGRDANYDTNLDPVVRTTAGDVRKRIAQYYHDSGHESEIKIDLPAGSYLPEFHLPSQAAVGGSERPAVSDGGSSSKSKPYVASFTIGAVACLVIVLAAVRLWAPRPAIELLWDPVLSSSAPVLIAIGEPPHTQVVPNASPSVSAHMTSGDHVAFSDAVSLSRLAGFLGQHRKIYTLQSAQATNFTDLQRGPVVLIAGLDNEWTRRATAPLRFYFASGAANPNLFWIEDRKNPSNRDWMVDFGIPYSTLTQDYAIVGRFADPATGQTTVIAAGIGDNGTAVAGEFLTNPKYAEVLAQSAPKDWAGKNIEVVLATQVINGKSGPPRVLAVETW